MIDIRSHPANFSRSRRIVIWKHTDTRQCRILFLTDGNRESISSMLFISCCMTSLWIWMHIFHSQHTTTFWHATVVINIPFIQDMMPLTLNYVQTNHRLCHNYTSVSCLIKMWQRHVSTNVVIMKFNVHWPPNTNKYASVTTSILKLQQVQGRLREGW